MPRLRRPHLAALPRPRPLSVAEVDALRQRPWPRLPWWLWVAAVLTTGAMVIVAAVLLVGPEPEQVPLGARRSPPPRDARRSHDTGPTLVQALEPTNRNRVVTMRPACARLDRMALVGIPEDAELLRRATAELCALRSTEAIERARRALQEAGATVAFAGFTASGNESTLVVGSGGGLTVLVNGKFARGGPERIAVLLVHEGTHAARHGSGSRWLAGEDELAARRAELEACRLVFPDWSQANKGCRDAEDLLGEPDPLALLRQAGYP